METPDNSGKLSVPSKLFSFYFFKDFFSRELFQLDGDFRPRFRCCCQVWRILHENRTGWGEGIQSSGRIFDNFQIPPRKVVLEIIEKCHLFKLYLYAEYLFSLLRNYNATNNRYLVRVIVSFFSNLRHAISEIEFAWDIQLLHSTLISVGRFWLDAVSHMHGVWALSLVGVSGYRARVESSRALTPVVA